MKWLVQPNGLELHLSTQHLSTFPCHVSFDYIGTIETISVDQKVILSRINISIPLAGNTFNYTKVKDQTAKLVSMIGDDIMEKYYEKFKIDFELFGYTRFSDQRYPYSTLSV